MPNLAGLHDREGQVIAPPDTWIVDTIALSENPQPTNYVGSLHWIGRLNWGYGERGTLPVPDQYPMFAQRVAAYVAASKGCSRWIIGNEPNLPREWPDGQPIYPWSYAACYKLCRDAIHALSGHEHDEVLIAVPGPWNDQLKYPGNSQGDWIGYFLHVIETLEELGGEIDGFSAHAYTHGYNPALVKSEARMNAPFQNRRYEFHVYQDFVEATPSELSHLPWYITEANGNGPWQAVGLMPAMLADVNAWNQRPGKPKVRCVVFFRYPDFDDGFHIEGKGDVIAEYQAACALGYQSPKVGAVTPTQEPSKLFIPKVSTPMDNSEPPMPERKIDQRATARGVRIETPPITPGEDYWFVETIRYYDEQEADGLGPDHHMMIDVLDEAGKRLSGIPLHIEWGDGGDFVWTEAKPGEPYSANKPLTPGDFSVRVANGLPSEKVINIKMGEGTAQGFNPGIHTTHGIVFRRRKMATSQPPIAYVPVLVHPVTDPQYRAVTQVFGINGDYYKRFKVDGVPLKGHNGIDFGTPVGTTIVAVDDGVAVEVANDESGYGEYVKLRHPWGESLYAHLLDQYVHVGELVGQGERIGATGNTGNSTGPHLHFGLRVNPYNRQDGWGGYSDPAPSLNNTGAPPQPQPEPLPDYWAIRLRIAEVALEFDVELPLLESLAWAESSWNPNAHSDAGAKGIMQLMDATWAEWSAKVGAGNNPFDTKQNLRVGAAYFAWLLKTLGNEWSALCAYNFGIGNVLNQIQPPDETVEFANKVLHGRDLLNVVVGESD